MTKDPEKRRAYYLRNRESIIAKNKLRYALNPDEAKTRAEYSRAYRKKNRHRILAQKKAYWAAHPEKLKERNRRKRIGRLLRNPEKEKSRKNAAKRRQMERLRLAEATLKALIAGSYNKEIGYDTSS